MLSRQSAVKLVIGLTLIAGIVLSGCVLPPNTTVITTNTTSTTISTTPTYNHIDRLEKIPSGVIKVTPEMDMYPPILYSDEYEIPVPLGSGVNTAGGEDSPFILPNGNTLYFFFTPDVTVPAEKQVLDGVTGIWVSHKVNGVWQPAERVWLQDADKYSMDGAECIQGNTMWFATARAGNFRNIDIWTAELINGKWQNWRNAGPKLNAEYQIGEMHITAAGNEIYFHAPKTTGSGDVDIFVTRKVNGEWQPPESIDIVNTTETDGWPFVSQDGNELWFLRTYMGTPAILVSHKINGEWTEPEMIISQFAGEPTLDNAGNLYFVHHFYDNGVMLEADIYVAYRK